MQIHPHLGADGIRAGLYVLGCFVRVYVLQHQHSVEPLRDFRSIRRRYVPCPKQIDVEMRLLGLLGRFKAHAG